MQEYIARFGHGSAKLARQAQSKEKTMAKMVAVGLTEKVVTEKVGFIYFNFISDRFVQRGKQIFICYLLLGKAVLLF